MKILTSKLPKRTRENPKLKLFYERYYRGCKVASRLGPLIENYLDRTYDALTYACGMQNKTFVFRLDLRFPDDMEPNSMHAGNDYLSFFLHAFEIQLLALRREHVSHIHRANFRYVWCREQKDSDKPHYHLLILLNGNVFHQLGSSDASALGRYQDNTLIHAAIRAWGWALSRPTHMMKGLVEIPKKWEQGRRTNKYFHCMLHRNDPDIFAEVMYVASYLCKYYSKPLGQRIHCFDASKKPTRWRERAR
ncbi:YagK/YfjJ domain-containing protein [Halomonas sp. AOP13-D3-9]